ncbi:MAG TPA: Xaa-Pro peptidase family protein [Planctomycetia bacterium]|nr:Xaa-Pro peptidase family protein [Planctomycetia bacterium]
MGGAKQAKERHRAKDRHVSRREKLGRICRDMKLDAILVTDPVNVSYLTGFAGDSSYLFVSYKEALLLSDSRFTEQIEEECPGLPYDLRKSGELHPAAVARIVKEAKYAKLAFEAAATSVANLEAWNSATKTAAFLPTTGLVEKLRAIKDPDEIISIQAALKIADKAFAALKGRLGADPTERELANLLDAAMRNAGASCAAFPPIVAVGGRAAMAHAIPGDRRVSEDPLLLIDWGARGRFYNSDCTRMLYRGKPSAKFEKAFEIVLQANRKATAGIRPGAKAAEVDALARNHITQSGYGKRFGHGLGHGLGMQVHEAPFFRPGGEHVLEAGMVVTVEPGIYLPGWGGIRIEDVVRVTDDGCETLTALPRDLDSCRWD